MKFIIVLLVLVAITAIVALVIRKRNSRKPVQVQSSLRQERTSYNLPASTSYTGSVYQNSKAKPAPYSANRSKPSTSKPKKHSDDSVIGSDYDASWATEPTTYNEPVHRDYGYSSGGSSDSGYSSGYSSSGSSDSGYSSGGSSSSYGSSDSGSSGGSSSSD